MYNFFETYFFELLPYYFKKNDSYKDENDEGLLERYLKIFGLELDQEVTPWIENLLDIVDIKYTDDKYLPLLSGILGFIPSFGLSTYRKILAYAIAIYKCKGTILSYKILFNILGYQVTVIEQVPKRKTLYDSGFIYDEIIPEQYDTECQRCSYYFLILWPNDNPPTFEITPEITALVKQVTNFLEPINAKFGGLYTSAYGRGLITENNELWGGANQNGDYYLISG